VSHRVEEFSLSSQCQARQVNRCLTVHCYIRKEIVRGLCSFSYCLFVVLQIVVNIETGIQRHVMLGYISGPNSCRSDSVHTWKYISWRFDVTSIRLAVSQTICGKNRKDRRCSLILSAFVNRGIFLVQLVMQLFSISNLIFHQYVVDFWK